MRSITRGRHVYRIIVKRALDATTRRHGHRRRRRRSRRRVTGDDERGGCVDRDVVRGVRGVSEPSVDARAVGR